MKHETEIKIKFYIIIILFTSIIASFFNIIGDVFIQFAVIILFISGMFFGFMAQKIFNKLYNWLDKNGTK